jgi:hypothetical protein
LSRVPALLTPDNSIRSQIDRIVVTCVANCSKNTQFTNSWRREPYVNARKSDGATGRAKH